MWRERVAAGPLSKELPADRTLAGGSISQIGVARQLYLDKWREIKGANRSEGARRDWSVASIGD
ncbi:hypothetical protein PLANPX_0557 [Lacipirellula parvula]|uniref:Uncharacterized protein n=1 Tax=Lacipirellula parvula TaxID=2650471 RepID=A0A5K7X3J6_9BACT|nr:hypothetical protein PLANPX_0557 [Lacipirellula parvula]